MLQLMLAMAHEATWFHRVPLAFFVAATRALNVSRSDSPGSFDALHWCLPGSWKYTRGVIPLSRYLQPWCPNHQEKLKHQVGCLCIQASSPKTSRFTPVLRLHCHLWAKELWKCFMAQYVLPFIKTPFFVVNSFYDSWQFHDRKGKLCCNIVVCWYDALAIWLSHFACIFVDWRWTHSITQRSSLINSWTMSWSLWVYAPKEFASGRCWH